MIRLSFDVTAPPQTRQITNLTSRDFASFSDTVTGLPIGETLIQAVFTAKLVLTDADTAPTAVRKIVNTTVRDDGQIIGNVFTFNFLPNDTQQFETPHVYDIQVWTQTASGVVRYRTVLTGTVSAGKGISSLEDLLTISAIGSSVSVEPNTAVNYIGFTQQFIAKLRDLGGSIVSTSPSAWTSSNPAIATVSPTGVVLSVGEGVVTITATFGSLTGSAALTIYNQNIVISGIPQAADLATRNFEFSLPNQNQRVHRLDTGDIEMYQGVAWATKFYGKSSADTLLAAKSNVGHVHAFSELTSVPTTVTGYGITDVYTKTVSDARYAPIAVPAASLTGTALPAGIVTSSLTSVGVLAAPHMTSAVVDSGGLTVTAGGISVTAGTTAVQALTAAGTITQTRAGATNPLLLGALDIDTTYSYLALNGVATVAGMGFIGGGGTDKSMYYEVPTAGMHQFRVNRVVIGTISASGPSFSNTLTVTAGGLTVSAGTTAVQALTTAGAVGFNGAAALAKPTITGSRGGIVALASILTQLATYGLITDSTTA